MTYSCLKLIILLMIELLAANDYDVFLNGLLMNLFQLTAC